MPNRRSALRSRPSVLLLTLFGLTLAVLTIIWVRGNDPAYATTDVRLGDATVELQIADTDAKRTLGLGGRDGLDEHKGMLFTFPKPQELCFWMKDMRFAIDMIWLNDQRRIIKIEHDVRPDTYPDISYCSPKQQPARYVIELDAGEAKRLKLHTGQQLDF